MLNGLEHTVCSRDRLIILAYSYIVCRSIFLRRTEKLCNNPSQRRRTESKPDTYNKDRIFVTSFAFCVITYEPIEVQTFSAPQNDRQNLVFVKDIKVVVEKMTRNRRKVIGKPGDSLLCRLHSIQLSSLGILFSMSTTY